MGREQERRVIQELLAPRDGLFDVGDPGVVAFVGVAGSGRTSLVGLAAAMATAAGRRVLAVAGVHDDQRLPLAGLSQIVLPFLDQVASLPAAHREALGRPLGLVAGGGSFDLVATGMAVLALLTQRREAPPVLVLIDDADYVDAETLSVLAFVIRRMDRRQAVLLLTAQVLGLPVQFGRNVRKVRIGPLSGVEAQLLLEREGFTFSAAVRQRIIDQSAGSPLVLLETAAVALRLGVHTLRSSGEPIGVGPVITERVMAGVRVLATETQERLVDAAVAETYSGAFAGASRLQHRDLTWCEPAERAGIVSVDRSGVRFTHPAFWIAILQATPFAAQIAAHQRVAAAFADEPSRRAWHLARAAIEPDEVIAALLEAGANDIGLQLGRLEKALTLERAAQLSPDGDQRARRLLAAAGTAAPTGELAWVDELTRQAVSCAIAPRLQMKAITTSAWAAAARGRFSAAMADLSRAAVQTVDSVPEAAWEVMSIAAAVGYQSGSRATQAQMLGVARRLAATQEPVTLVARARSLWIESFLRPGIDTTHRLENLAQLCAEGPTDEPTLSRLAAAAWLDDESQTAFDLANAAFHRLLAHGSYAAAAVVGPILSWTAWDTGSWDVATKNAALTSQVAETAGGGMLQATDDAVAALVCAARGDDATAQVRARAALALIQGQECLSVQSRVNQARGLSAIASGNYGEAFKLLSRLFKEDGAPLHWHISYFGIGDLAAAAQRSDQLSSGRTLLGRVLTQLPPDPAIRIRHLILRAQALLAENEDDAELFFAQAQLDPAGSRWPFERAQLLLDYGALLRRKRRLGEAKPLLIQAHEIFDRLGAIPWKTLAETELRASHVEVPRPAGALEGLTGQQREIVLLAGQGLTNREIGTRLYLSPRTVASHLYRSFPKLGIRDRWQLRDLLDEEKPSQARDSPAPSVS